MNNYICGILIGVACGLLFGTNTQENLMQESCIETNTIKLNDTIYTCRTEKESEYPIQTSNN